MIAALDLSRIPTALGHAAQLAAAGERQEAARLLGELRTELKAASAGSFQNALARIAAGDIRLGEEALVAGIVLQRQFADFVSDWPVARADYLGQLALIYLQRGHAEAAEAAIAMAEPEFQSYYETSPTCSIAILDALYQQAFGRRRDGVFIEVGAFDGEDYSNSSGLADLGWRGLYIEPIAEFAERCKARHAANRAVSVEAVAVGADDRTIELSVAGPLTRSPEHSYKVQGRIVQVPQRRLDDLLTQHQIEPGFELLVVDVEGQEPGVFAGFSLDHWRPRMMIVEMTEEPESIALAQRIEGAGYEIRYRDFVNTIFCATAPR